MHTKELAAATVLCVAAIVFVRAAFCSNGVRPAATGEQMPVDTKITVLLQDIAKSDQPYPPLYGDAYYEKHAKPPDLDRRIDRATRLLGRLDELHAAFQAADAAELVRLTKSVSGAAKKIEGG